jgi:hypothetical protein
MKNVIADPANAEQVAALKAQMRQMLADTK